MSGLTTAEYGTWKSPITSVLATENSVSFNDINLDSAPDKSGTVYWSELRFDEGGRYVICSSKAGKSDVTSLTPQDFSARTLVHEYGGGAFFVHNDTIYFSNFSDQRLYKQLASGGAPQALTAEDNNCRYADGCFSKLHNKIYIVCEDHSLVKTSDSKEPSNTVVSIDADSGAQVVIASGCDFYSSPRVSPDGKKLAWVQWVHPNMPWDSTEIWQCTLDKAGTMVQGSATKVAGGEGTSVMQPRWTPEGQLMYTGDQTDWWNLYLIKEDGSHDNVCPKTSEMAPPSWEFDPQNSSIDPSGSGNVIFTCSQGLHLVNLKSRECRVIKTGYEHVHHLHYSTDGHVYAQAAGPRHFACIVRIYPETGNVDVIQESRSVSVDTGYFSVPREISWPTTDGKTSHGYFYPPQNKDYKVPEGSLPPLLVKVHGGPTAAASPTLGLKIQYFTSRGFGVLDVNYRGSTGYGKDYRNELHGNWGICDVDDCSNGALYLADNKEVDRERLCIDGGSAGGYTTLACLAFKDIFKAGASHYGVADISALARDTHKFESRYMDTLIAPINDEANSAIYEARSPLHHIDKFNCAIAFFQGDDDKIVPPNQAEMMYSAIKDKGLPTTYVLFEGEQHGFRKAENIQKALDGEFYFFSKVFGFEAADNNVQLDIVNLK